MGSIYTYIGKKAELAKNALFSNFKRLSSPYKVTFAATYKCNLKCKICRIWEGSRKDELDIEEIEKVFRSLKNLCWLALTGGEVSLRKDAAGIAKAIINSSRKLLIFHISTNGQLPRDILLLTEEIIRLGVTPIVNVSIDGPRVVNDDLRGVKGGYLRGLETFKLLKSLGRRGYYYLSCTISDHNINHLDELISELKEDITGFSAADLHFNIFHNSSHYYRNCGAEGASRLTFDNVKEYIKLCAKGNLIKAILEKRYIKGLSEYLKGNKFPRQCQAFKSTCFIDPYGEVYPCGIYNRPAGNLRKYDYNMQKLWAGPDTLKVRESIKDKGCPGCWSPCEAYPAILGSIAG